MKVSVILPTLNEKENLAPLISSILTQFAERVEIVIVDDRSEDGTAEIADRISASDQRVRVIHRHNERGLTSAIQRGIDESTGEVVCWMDVDFSHPPELLPVLTRFIEFNQADVVVASRYLPQSRDLTTQGAGVVTQMQKILSRTLSAFCRLLLQNDQVSDWSSGFVAIRSEPLKKCRLDGDYGEYFIGLMQDLRALGCRCIAVPYVSPPRRFGYSKTAVTWWGLAARGHKYLWTLIKVSCRRYPKDHDVDKKAAI